MKLLIALVLTGVLQFHPVPVENVQPIVEDATYQAPIKPPSKAKPPRKKVVKASTPDREVKPILPQVSGSHQDWLRAAGVPKDVWSCASALVMRESGWRVDATNPTSGAYGLPQALPGNKMATAGADWRTSPVTQLKWMDGYVTSRYGGWCQANSFQLSHGWY